MHGKVTDEDLDDLSEHPISMYGTIRPRTFANYRRALSNKLPENKVVLKQGESLDHQQDGSSSSGKTFTTSQEFKIGEPTTSRTAEIPISRTLSASGRPVIQMLSMGPVIRAAAGGMPLIMPGDSSIEIERGDGITPESASLLDQLRTHGYRNLVTQRLSGTKLGEPKFDPDENIYPGDYKKGKF